MRKFLVLLACAALLCGCTKSNIVQPDSETKVADPDFSIKDDIEIDWEQVSTEADEIFTNKNDFPYSEDFHFMLQPSTKEIMLMWIVADDLPNEEIQNYADRLIKGFNDLVSTQDFSIEKSSDDSFGGLWKDYSLTFGIAPVSTQDDQESWFISGNYGAGVEFVLPDVNAAIKKANEIDAEENASGAAETTAAGAEAEAAESGADETEAAQ